LKRLVLLLVVACDPQKADWGLGAIDRMPTPPDPTNVACGGQFQPASLEQCAFTAGAHASQTLGISAQDVPIRHVIVLMKENRSFDHLFGKLHDQGQPDVEAVPASYANLSTTGTAVFPSHATTTCIAFDPGHQSASVAECIDNGRMDGFVVNAANTTTSDGTFVMSYYDDTDLPFYYWLATSYAVSDRHFAPTASGTFANRNFLVFGSNGGVVDTGLSFPSPATPSLFQTLMNAGFTWRSYTDGSPLSGALDWSQGDPGVSTLDAFFTALDAGTLPNVAFVDGLDNVEDDHPLADLQTGEAWVRNIYEHAVKSPQWDRLVIFWTYDEAGAFADHVPPPSGCLPVPSLSPFEQMGPRVPLVAISPWAKRNYASHVVHDHTAITRFIEAIFDLPALTARDANSDALTDLFDFTCGRDVSVQPPPAAGTGGCPNPPPVGP
jgi:phospholipase C